MRTIKDISHADSHQGRYIVVRDTPDNGRSTWEECFGPHGKAGRAFFASDSLPAAVAMMCRYSFIIDRQTGREVGKARIEAASQSEASA